MSMSTGSSNRLFKRPKTDLFGSLKKSISLGTYMFKIGQAKSHC